MTDRCARCPVSADVHCRGLDVRRYCKLIDPAHAKYDSRYVDVILRRSRQPADPIPAATSLHLLERMKACQFRSVDPGCGCSGGRCGLRDWRLVSHLECFECIIHERDGK